MYAYGNIVAETLPIALIIARESQGFGDALGMASLLPKYDASRMLGEYVDGPYRAALEAGVPV